MHRLIEEPRLNDALQELLKMLDHEVLKALAQTSGRSLDAEAVAEAEAALQQPSQVMFQEAIERARKKVKGALCGWLEATESAMRRQEPPDSN